MVYKPIDCSKFLDLFCWKSAATELNWNLEINFTNLLLQVYEELHTYLCKVEVFLLIYFLLGWMTNFYLSWEFRAVDVVYQINRIISKNTILCMNGLLHKCIKFCAEKLLQLTKKITRQNEFRSNIFVEFGWMLQTYLFIKFQLCCRIVKTFY